MHLTGGDNTASKLTLTNTAPSPDNTWSLHPIYNGQDLLLQEDGTTRVTFKEGGNVGIGTTSPSVPLQVNHGSSSVGLYTLGSYNFQAKFESSDAEAAIVIEDSNSGTDYNRIGVITNDMAFTTNNSERLRIDSSGKVGIAYTSPSSMSLSQLTVGGGSGDAGISLFSGTSSISRLMFADGTSGGAEYDGFLAYNHTNQDLQFGTAGSGGSKLTLTSAGHLGIVSTARFYLDSIGDTYMSEYSANEFEIQTGGARRFALSGGNAYFSGSVTENHNFSDERLKENIVVIPNALEKVTSLRGITFTRKSDKSVGTGLIAQELEKVLPEAVFTSKTIDSLENPDAEEYKGIRYETTVGLLVEAIKELEERIKILEG